jgi:glycosyltransferase involved in cell wall biosynthesis
MKKLSVVIPVLNEDLLLNELVKQVADSVDRITNDYEIIIVDDGSSDNTWNLITQEGIKNKKVKGIKFSRNFGHHYAITAGLHKAEGEWTIVMDGDLQDRPEVIPDLYKKAIEGFDIVFVSRENRTDSIFYKVAQKTYYFLLRLLSGINFDSSQANFSIINRKVVKAFIDFPENARFYGSTITWLGFNRTHISANHGARYLGTPSYTLKKRLKLAADVILAFSDRPLKIAISLGILASTFALSMAIFIIYGALNWGYVVLGWPSVIVTIVFFSGNILIVLGILGLYIGRIFAEVKNRPLFVVSDTINLI